jgi:hypothetical protein
LFELAESRRREFRRTPLAEFPLTLAQSSVSPKAAALELTQAGVVQPK